MFTHFTSLFCIVIINLIRLIGNYNKELDCSETNVVADDSKLKFYVFRSYVNECIMYSYDFIVKVNCY